MADPDTRQPLVLLHGLAGHGGEWDPVCSLLNSPALTPDLPGHGSRFDLGRQAGTRLEISELLDWADALVGHVAQGRPVVLVGQSMGGLVAMRLARRNPALVSHLVLVEAGTGTMTGDDLARLGDWFDSWPDLFADADEAARFFGADRPSTPAWVAGLRSSTDGLTRRFDPATMLALMEDLAGAGSAEVWRDLAAIGIPTTVLVADNGMIGDADLAAMLESYPAANVVRIADAGHDVHLDQPAAVADAIANILTS